MTGGAEAVFRALARAPGRGLALWAYRHVPGVAQIAEGVYALVASNRPVFSMLTLWLWGRGAAPPSFDIARRVTLIALAGVYLIAFASFGVQVAGLSGENGVAPAASFLDAVRSRFGDERYATFPTIFWWTGASAATLKIACWAGAAVSVLLLVGLAPPLCLFVLWALYLSLSTVCRPFLDFQWDTLLLEAGFLAIFAAPLRWWFRPSRARPPSGVALFLLRWLLFRLMFGSGIVKLTSGDETWWSLTALTVHYETQPIPTWTAWYVHQAPVWFHRLSCAGMFFVELVVPFLIFAPRRLRHAAFWLLVGFQAALIATGNYAFFNVLTIALCLPLLDDGAWPGFVRRWVLGPRAEREDAGRREDENDGAGGGSSATRRRCPLWISVPPAALVVVLGTQAILARARLSSPDGAVLSDIHDVISPFRSLNAYGLFADMTESRPEIIVEGSDDGRTWAPYEFTWKPGDVNRPPGFVAPHQPRLDWQMWFAALGTYQGNPWFIQFLRRLLEGSPEVLALIEKNPYPDRPPRQVRAVLYDYHFTDAATRRSTGAWWRREPLRLYCPVLSLESFAGS